MSLELTFAAVDQSTWGDLERLFEQRGGPHYCWCMLWRPMQQKDRKDKVAKKNALQSRVADDVPVGLLAYSGGDPVAWCSVAPKATFRRLGPKAASGAGEDIWSITCFFISRPFRGQGIATSLIEAAAAYARDNGARVIESYPVAKDSPSYRFMGLCEQFESAGFSLVGEAGARRHVMQRRLD